MSEYYDQFPDPTDVEEMRVEAYARMNYQPSESAIQHVMDTMRMGYIQARNHLISRYMLRFIGAVPRS